MISHSRFCVTAAIATGIGFGLLAPPCWAWGDEGHEIVAIVAAHFMTSAARTQVAALLAGDATGLTSGTGMAAEATWADKFRDSDRNGAQIHYRATRAWHFIDIELADGDERAACTGAQGPSQVCVVEKIDEFIAELKDSRTPIDERRQALQFLLHLIGDVHQPLHASDDHDQGGNAKRVKAPGFRGGNLHHYWDTEFVRRLGRNEQQVAEDLIGSITRDERQTWQHGDAAQWARESFVEARAHAYGKLPAPVADDRYLLPAAYVSDATTVVRRQLSRAGVRLAWVLNETLQ
jgi:S1/P1 Nuclease